MVRSTLPYFSGIIKFKTTVASAPIPIPDDGWEYETTGECSEIPQLPEGRAISKKAKATKYACIERYGFIWINLENSDVDLFEYPEFDNESFHSVVCGPQEVMAKPPRIIENFLDVGHLSIVHEGFLGEQEHPVMEDYDIHGEEKGIRSSEIAIYQPDPDGSGEAKYAYYTYEIIRPLTVRFTKKDHEKNQEMVILFTILPVTEEKSIAFGMLSFNYDSGQTNQEIIEFQNMIFSQDKPIVENQKPEELPLDLQVELSLKSDKVSIAYRQYLKKLGVTLGTA